MKPKYIAVGDMIHVPSMTGGNILISTDIAKLLNSRDKIIQELKELVKESFIEGHNVDYYKEVKRPVLSYWLESESSLKLKGI